MDEDLSREQVAAVIDAVVEELLLDAGLRSPPVDAIALARDSLGFRIEFSENRKRRRPVTGTQQLVLVPGDRAEVQHWHAAQAIGDYLKPTILERLGLERKQSRLAGESLANLLAYRLLAPTRWFADDVRMTGHDLFALKERYPTASHEVLAWRFLDSPEPCIVTIIDNDTVHRRRSNGIRMRRQLEAMEHKCWQMVVEHGEPNELQEGGWHVRGWPIVDLDWKREILHSTVDVEEANASGYDPES